jgi:hypothetical protein
MSPMANDPAQPKLPIHAGPSRRAFHSLVALAGWALFAYWWWLVARRVSAHEIRFTLLVIAIALGVILVLTALWVLHNIRIFRIRGPRQQMRTVAQDSSRDTVGRNVQFPAVPEDCLSAAVVHVRIREGVKIYLPAAAAGGTTGPVGGEERR